MFTQLVTLAVLLAAVFLLISIYNRLVSLRTRYQNGFAQIEVQLKRRYDLIPNLVESTKAYLAHERQTLEAVIAARNGAVEGLKQASQNLGDANSMKLLAGAEAVLSNAMGRLNLTVEAYPELQASENMRQLTEELSSTENKIAFARQAYNDAVAAYNSYRQSFPSNVLATTFGHGKDAALLEFSDSAAIQEAPKVSF